MPEADDAKNVELGELLRRTREARGVSLEEASRTTKISRNYLAAIEEGDFEKLPNRTYIKGFLRSYAAFLGLSGDEVVAGYDSSMPGPAPVPGGSPSGAPTIELVERVRFGGHGRWAVPALLLSLVILAALLLTEGQETRERPAPKPQPPQAQSQPQPGAVPPEPYLPPQPVLPPVSSAGGSALPPLSVQALPAPGGAPVKGVNLRLRFNRDSWLTITIDDSITQRYDLKAGDIVEWKGERLFSLELGDGGAVEADFNGRPLKPLGEPGRPVHVELKGEGQ